MHCNTSFLMPREGIEAYSFSTGFPSVAPDTGEPFRCPHATKQFVAPRHTFASLNYAEGGHRTLMMLPSQDFESCASANSATSAIRTLYSKTHVHSNRFGMIFPCDRIKGTSLHTFS